ncbi:acetate/propionate family kinase [Latilactobacillus fragifolii]|uniref:acetate/propionate family kinase n=1 Tax=Latilactobacillus fragifolii TaxID=2814244 RepID=UPI001ABB733D|nr:acetate kinase [Latilactobacillus fragifolii]
MNKILVVNAGSSSLKWQLFQQSDLTLLASGLMERMNTPEASFTFKSQGQKEQVAIANLSYEDGVLRLLKQLEDKAIIHSPADIIAVGHRVVAGATTFEKPTIIDGTNLDTLKQLAKYAPLHNPVQVDCIETLMRILPTSVPQVAVFDSQFYLDMPDATSFYGLPYAYSRDYQIRKYGEHGISHSYILQATAAFLNQPVTDLKLITLHLGGGSSITASQNGKPIDTSMGFTPLEGVPMGTRAGSLDAAIVPFLMNELDKSADEVITLLNTQSGILGVSGISADMRDIQAARATNPRAKLAYDMFITAAVKFIASYHVELGGANVITFTAGIGENDARLRADICEKLAVLGVQIDPELNENGTGARQISTPNSAIKVLMMPTNEELAIANQVLATI